MNGITRFGLDASRLTIVFVTLVIAAGLLQFMEFPRQEDPPIVIREIVISAQFPGMKAEDVEQLITRQIETELRAMPEIDDIWSDSKSGVAVVHADTADEYDDVDAIWQKVRNRMLDLAPRLPAGTIGPIVNDEFGLVAVATIALWAEGFDMAEMREAARDIRDRLYELDGIRKVELWGVHEEQVFLEFSTANPGHYPDVARPKRRAARRALHRCRSGRDHRAERQFPFGRGHRERPGRGSRYREVVATQGPAAHPARFCGAGQRPRLL
jgi:multidrug efflux pump subunit AcrB